MEVKLVYFKPNASRKDFPLAGALAVIGRGEECDIQVPLASISRRHCELRVAADGLHAKDLGSSNGTFVNNQRITEMTLKAGDRLVVGPIVFTIQIDGEPSTIKPVKTRGQKLAEAGGKKKKSEDVVELEPDVLAESDDVDILTASGSSGEDIDPISALEALAADNEPEDENK